MKDVKKTIEKVRHTISKYNMIRRGDLVVIAVSGGADSVCLLDVLHDLKDDLGIKLIVAHFNHGLRPGEDENETQHVEYLAASLYLPFETEKVGHSFVGENGSLEERLRTVRYQFLEQVKEKHSAHKIAMGHTLNDQAETVLMRLLRGSGPSGLAGIPPFRGDGIIRPLIEISRGEIESYLSKKRLKYMTDSSNSETKYLRNRIRLELLPELKRYQPRIVELLGQTAEIMRIDDEWLAANARSWAEEKLKEKDKKIYIPLPAFKMLSQALKNRVIREALRRTGGNLRGINLRHIAAVNHVALGKRSQAHVDLPNGLIAKRIYERLVFTVTRDRQDGGVCYFLKGPGIYELETLGCTASLEEMENTELPDMGGSSWSAFFNADLINYPLIIRNFREGDRFVPFGMKGHKKLKDFFIDLKIPSETRGRIPILACRNDIVWVCGLRIDNRFKVTPETKKVLKITVNSNCSRE